MDLNKVSVVGMQEFIKLSLRCDEPALVLGHPGGGKSEVIESTCREAGYVPVYVNLGQSMPEESAGIGMPVQVESDSGEKQWEVEQSTPDTIKRCWDAYRSTGKAVALFLDEITSAPPAIQAANYPIFNEKRLGRHMLPPGTRVLAAGNLATDRGVVHDLATPLLNRCMVVGYTGPTHDEFMSYADKTQMDHVVKTFIKVNPHVLHAFNPDAEQSCTPRSLNRLSNLISDELLPPQLRMAVAASCIGDEEAANLEAFIEIADHLVPFGDILNSPLSAPVDTDFAVAFMQIGSVANKLTAHVDDLELTTNSEEELKAKTNEAVDAVWGYVARFPAEFQSSFLLSASYKFTGRIVSKHLPAGTDSTKQLFETVNILNEMQK